MLGQLRVPKCFITRSGYSKSPVKFDLFTCEKIRKHWSIIPLLAVNCCMLIAVPLLAFHRLFYTTIDVPLAGYYRFEIPTIPRFFDLRNPRSLKLVQFGEWKPAIHLDNRYRLMRGEPMLDAEGNETDEIGKDETAAPSPEQIQMMEEKGSYYFTPKKII